MINKPHQVIIDTDIGDDIDDTWALIYMLSKPDFDVKLICVTTGDVDYKADLVASILASLNRRIPIAKGQYQTGGTHPQAKYIKHHQSGTYEPYLTYDAALQDILTKGADYEMVLLGPVNDFYRFIKNHPIFASKIKILMMGGAIHKGYINQAEAQAEYNVLVSTEAMTYLMAQLDNFTLLPLDVCRDIIINGDDYQLIYHSDNNYARTIIENYQIWHEAYRGGAIKFAPQVSSSILYDLVVPFFMLFPHLYEVARLPLIVTAEGVTIIAEGGSCVNVALSVDSSDQLLSDLIRSIT